MEVELRRSKFGNRTIDQSDRGFGIALTIRKPTAPGEAIGVPEPKPELLGTFGQHGGKACCAHHVADPGGDRTGAVGKRKAKRRRMVDRHGFVDGSDSRPHRLIWIALHPKNAREMEQAGDPLIDAEANRLQS